MTLQRGEYLTYAGQHGLAVEDQVGGLIRVWLHTPDWKPMTRTNGHRRGEAHTTDWPAHLTAHASNPPSPAARKGAEEEVTS